MADPTQLQTGHIQFISPQEQEYFSQAVVGEEVRNFLNSSTGKLLHGCAKQTRQECNEEIFKIDPYTPEGKREHARIKMEAWCAEHFLKWCVEAIQGGEEAAVLLETYRD